MGAVLPPQDTPSDTGRADRRPYAPTGSFGDSTRNQMFVPDSGQAVASAAVECMALQGIKVSQNIAFKVKPSTMQSLAGNSFEASCALATMFATFAFLAKGSETTLQAGPATYAIRNGIALDWRGYPIDEDADL